MVGLVLCIYRSRILAEWVLYQSNEDLISPSSCRWGFFDVVVRWNIWWDALGIESLIDLTPRDQ